MMKPLPKPTAVHGIIFAIFEDSKSANFRHRHLESPAFLKTQLRRMNWSEWLMLLYLKPKITAEIVL